MKKSILSIFIVFAICVSFLPFIDKISYENNDKLFKRSIATFAIAKGLNGVISLLQGTEIGGSVVFANATFSVGEILDPLNDMVERFSWVMLASSIALGVEKILIQISGTFLLKYLFCSFGALLLLTMWYEKLSILKPWLLKIFLILMLVRFVMPITEFVNEQIFTNFTSTTYNDAKKSLAYTQNVLENTHKTISKADKKNKTILDSLSSTFDFSLEEKFQNLKTKLNKSYENMLSLMIIFIFQTILFPLFTIFICYKSIIFILLKNR